MIFNMYVIYDVKASVYNRPFYLINDAVAARVAIDLTKDAASDISRHPEDFIMFKLGTFDDQTASFELNSSPAVMFRMHEIQHSLDS